MQAPAVAHQSPRTHPQQAEDFPRSRRCLPQPWGETSSTTLRKGWSARRRPHNHASRLAHVCNAPSDQGTCMPAQGTLTFQSDTHSRQSECKCKAQRTSSHTHTHIRKTSPSMPAKGMLTVQARPLTPIVCERSTCTCNAHVIRAWRIISHCMQRAFGIGGIRHPVSVAFNVATCLSQAHVIPENMFDMLPCSGRDMVASVHGFNA